MPEPADAVSPPPETTLPPESVADTAPSTGDDDKADVRASFREALARKHAKNSRPESHLDGHSVGTGNNNTHKRQFRRKSG
jgi:hypothetical protein